MTFPVRPRACGLYGDGSVSYPGWMEPQGARVCVVRAVLLLSALCALSCSARADESGRDVVATTDAADVFARNATQEAGPSRDADAVHVDGAGADALPQAAVDAESPAASCPVATMDVTYAGPLPPDPYGPIASAPACAMSWHDAIIVLGCPNNSDGTPSTCQTTRADIAVDLMRAGLANQFITSGAAVHNAYVEADTLKSLLIARGVPSSQIWEDVRAEHTDENMYYSTKIMAAHGWSTAFVVSDDPGQLIADDALRFQLLRRSWQAHDLSVRTPRGSDQSGPLCGVPIRAARLERRVYDHRATHQVHVHQPCVAARVRKAIFSSSEATDVSMGSSARPLRLSHRASCGKPAAG